MAMNRAEKAALESAKRCAIDAIEELEAARALGWPRCPEPETIDILGQLEHQPIGTIVTGWAAWSNKDEWRVSPGCSSQTGHSNDRIDKTTTHGRGQLYRTRAEALAKCRWEVSRRFAEVLAEIDRAMELERAKPSRIKSEVKAEEFSAY